MTKSFTLAILLTLSIFTSRAQIFEDPDFEREAQKGVELLYNFQFDAAEAVFLPLKDKYPNHPAPYFFLATNRWWQNYLSAQTPLYYKYVNSMIEKSLELNEQLADKPKLHMEYTFFQFMGNALKARVNAAQGNWWTAANAARKIITPIKEGFQYSNTRGEFAFASGIYHYYAEVYPREFPIVKPFMVFFPDGNEELGLRELKVAASQQHYAQIECLFYLSYIHLEERSDYADGLIVARTLHQRFPKNTWFRADYANALILNNQYTEARKILHQMISTFESKSGYNTRVIHSKQSRYTSHLMIKVYQYLGKIYLFKDKRYEQAKGYFEKSETMAKLANVEEDNLLAEDTYYIGRCYDGLGMREKAIAHYEKALDMEGNIYIRDEAKECLKSPCR
jgi:tetratricopeptide (TPR) repeat protein